MAPDPLPARGPAGSGDPRPTPPSCSLGGRGGFTMVEVIIAMVVLAFGLLGMAGTTALVVRQVTLADLATERSAVVQTTLERLRSLPFDSVRSGTATHGIFSAQWAVASPTNQWKTVLLITTGPGMTTGAGGFPVMGRSVPDTMVYRIIRP